jgi:hypothetical protein
MDTIDTGHPVNSNTPRYFATPPAKFIAMSVCTFGLYEIYWSYKNWRIIKERDDSQIMPFWRGIFYPLWHYSLLTELSKDLESSALSSGAYRGFLTAIVVMLNALIRLPDPYWLISMLTFLAFLPALKAMRRSDSTGVIQEQKSSFHLSNLIAYVFGGTLFAFVALSSSGFIPGTAVVTGDSLWGRDISYLREAEILGPEEEITYFYSGGMFSIAEDGQFFSEDYVTSYYQDLNTGETYVDYVSFSDISDIDVVWAETFLDVTVVTVSTNNDHQIELWLSSESKGDRKFVDAMNENWRKSQNPD